MAADDRFTKSVTLIKDLRPGLKNVTCVFIVIDKGSTNHTKDGSVVRKSRVADKSASVCFSLWNEQASAIDGGDILRLTKGYASLWKGAMVLYSGKYGNLEKIGEFNMLFSEVPDMSDSNQEFALRGGQQQQQQQQQQPPNPPGGRPPELRGTAGGPNNNNNGRMGPGPGVPAVSGNWNGNNHLSNSHPLDAPPPSLIGHEIIQEPILNGAGPFQHSQQKPSLGHSPHENTYYRVPLKTPYLNAPRNERYHPYNHRPPSNHN